MISNERIILISWVARSNDPYEWDSKKGHVAVDKDNNQIDGPTLALLFHPDSFLCGQITDIITFCRKSTKILKAGDRTDAVVSRELKQAIDRRSKKRITHTLIPWESDDPTDHEALFSFLKKQLPEIRMKNPQAELYLHLSPGTPQMHAIMLLMATSGFVTPALKMVKTYRSTDGKKGSERFKEVRLDISPFYQSYRNSRPHISTIDPGANLMSDDFERGGFMWKCFNEASKIALTDLPVLITGEVGTGKYAVASWIRLRSNYCTEANSSSWPAVSCGAHSSIDSFSQILYGDRAKGYQGVLSAADGDTLLLDEIELLSPEAQRLMVQLLDRLRFRLIATSNLPSIEACKNLTEPLKKRFMSPALELPPLRKVPTNDLVLFWKSAFRDAVLKYIDEHQQQKVMAWESTYRANIVALLRTRTLPGNLYDLKKIAATIVTSVSLNAHHKDAKEIYLQAISEYDATKSEAASHDISKVIALAFASGKQLDDNLPIGELTAKGKLKIKGFEKELKKFVADEITRLATDMKCGKEALCDLDRKTILEWSNLNREHDGSKCS